MEFKDFCIQQLQDFEYEGYGYCDYYGTSYFMVYSWDMDNFHKLFYEDAKKLEITIPEEYEELEPFCLLEKVCENFLENFKENAEGGLENADGTFRCESCGNIISSTNPEHYYLMNDCEVICWECISKYYRDEYIEDITYYDSNYNKRLKCNNGFISDTVLEKLGWVELEQDLEEGCNATNNKLSNAKEIMEQYIQQGYKVLWHINHGHAWCINASLYGKKITKEEV